MARLYADENIPRQLVEALRRLGHDVLAAREAGKANQALPDEAVLAYATSHGRAVITLNRRDFIRLHTVRPDHGGIVVCTQDADLSGQAGRIHDAILAAGDLAGQLLRITRPKT